MSKFTHGSNQWACILECLPVDCTALKLDGNKIVGIENKAEIRQILKQAAAHIRHQERIIRAMAREIDKLVGREECPETLHVECTRGSICDLGGDRDSYKCWIAHFTQQTQEESNANG